MSKQRRRRWSRYERGWNDAMKTAREYLELRAWEIEGTDAAQELLSLAGDFHTFKPTKKEPETE